MRLCLRHGWVFPRDLFTEIERFRNSRFGDMMETGCRLRDSIEQHTPDTRVEKRHLTQRENSCEFRLTTSRKLNYVDDHYVLIGRRYVEPPMP